MRTAYITHQDCLDHASAEDHPEEARRLLAINDALVGANLMGLLRHFDAPLVSREQLERVHSPAYLDRLAAHAPVEGMLELEDGDTWMNQHTLHAAARAAGAVVFAVDLVASERIDNAFCAIRPPGHHAHRDRAMGFCLYNNVAVGAAHAMATLGLRRIAIVDFDVHHGNGTESIFAGDSRVTLFSSFQHPYWPYPDVSRLPENVFSGPLPVGAGSVQFREMVMEQWLPRLDELKPEMVFISAGFDAHVDDEMGGLRLKDKDFGWITRELVGIAERHAGGRLISALEGGYHIPSLSRSVVAHVRALMGV